MTLAQKLILYALAVALLPLAATGFALIHWSEEALRERIQQHQTTAAVAVAGRISMALQELSHRFATVLDSVDVWDLEERERQGLARMLFRQSRDVAVALLLDPQGSLLGQPAFLSSDPGGHPLASEEDVARLLENLPWRQVQAGSVLMGPVEFRGKGQRARLPVAIGGRPSASGQLVVAGVDLEVGPEILHLSEINAGPGSEVLVVDRQGRVVEHPGRPAGASLTSHGGVAAFLASRATGVARYRRQGQTRAAAFAEVGGLGWAVVVEQPESVAFEAAAQMRARILAAVLATLALVLASGFWFAGLLRSRLRRMVVGARAFGEGRLHEHIQVHSGDEMEELASTMNQMATDLTRSLQELEAWGRTLEHKVEERTSELREAQAQLLLQAKLAAVGQLGAGVAHEVNNPLAGILGYAQLLLKRRDASERERGYLKRIEEAAQRCRDVTTNLLRFSERGLAGSTEVSLNDLVDEVVGIMGGTLEEGRIELSLQLAEELPHMRANAGEVAMVLVNLLTNAKNAMGDGGRLTVATAAVEGGIELLVRDTGHGITSEDLPRVFEPFFTTKRVWSSVGLGLAVAYRIVTDHGGQIDVESEPGSGACFRVTLPRNRQEPEA